MKKSTTALILAAALASLGSCRDDEARTAPLRILVTNDDGVGAEGIDALVEALSADAANEIVVVAPEGNRSGSGDATGPSERCGDLSVSQATTRSGHPATAIDGCPADAVLYALSSVYPEGEAPDVVLSGINEGQNLSRVIATQVSGTVGAAKTAARHGIPALAASQGLPGPGGKLDFEAGAEAVLAWLADHRDALAAGGAPVAVENMNIPSCNGGSIRGTLADLPLAATAEGAFDPQDCLSTLENPSDDVEAFVNGFIALSDIPF